MWTCPKCGRSFASRNQWHSCVRYSLEYHLQGRPPHAVEIYRTFEREVKRCGPVTVAPVKTGIGFQAHVMFAAVAVRNYGIMGQLLLPKRVENRRFYRIESHRPQRYSHYLRIESVDEIDADLKRWIADAYKAGEQKYSWER